MTFSLQSIAQFHLSVLQLENYDGARAVGALRRRWLHPPATLRTPLVWTAKLRSVVALAVVVQIVCSVLLGWLIAQNSSSILAGIGCGFILFTLSFLVWMLFLRFALLMLWPLDLFLKHRILAAAQRKLSTCSDLTVIAITGSYGKTTMKEVLTAVLQPALRVLATPENINTPLGIARLILEKLTPTTHVLLVEMGAYKRGDIKQLCQLTLPDIAVLTGINESHLERFGSIENTIAAKFEIAEYAKPDATVLLNADDERIAHSFQQHGGNRRVFWYSALNNPKTSFYVAEIKFSPDGLHQTFMLERNGKPVLNATVPLLGRYIAGTVAAAVLVAEKLGVSHQQITAGLTSLRPVAHRLQPIRASNGALIIDDSYNGNPDGVAEAMHVLGRFSGRRKIFLTPGLVEMGEQKRAVHVSIGKQLAETADLVLLIRTSATQYIAEGLAQAHFPEERILWYDTAQKAHAAVPALVQPNDVILFQNDWPDNYQ